MKIFCLLGLHKWRPLHHKSFESYKQEGYLRTKIVDERLTREYCVSCGEIRNLIEFEGSIQWKKDRIDDTHTKQ